MKFVGRATKEEEQVAEETANRRYSESRQKGYKKLAKNYTHDMEVKGVVTEIEVARALGVKEFVPTVGSFKGADIGVNIQARGTAIANGHLIIKPNDNPEHFYILAVYPNYPEYKILGYCFGYEAPELCDKKDEEGKYWIPQSKLHPILDLFQEPKFLDNFTRPTTYTSTQTFTVTVKNWPEEKKVNI